MRMALLRFAALLPLAACGAGDDPAAGGEGRRRFAATGFDRVTLAGPDDIAVTIGPAFAVEAEGPPAAVDRMRVEVVDGDLRVARTAEEGGWLSRMRRERRGLVRVTLPVLRGVTVAGAGSATVAGAAAPVFVGAVEGAGSLDVRGLDAGNAAFELSGAGNITLAGRARDATMEVSGAGSIGAKALEVRDIDVSVSGVGNVDARATGRAQLRMGGVGNITLTGTDDCRITKSGVGNVTCGR